MKFIIEPDFWEMFPEAKIGIITAKGINNQKKELDTASLLREAEREAKAHLIEPELSANPVIKVWREAFQQFKTKKGARSSIEALLKRVSRGEELGTINPLVDLYNAISLKYGLPCGGEDMDEFVGDIRLTKADSDESFITLGSEESAPPYEGELVYKDEAGAICRCWNWRESVRTMLRDDTTNAFLCIELVDPSREEALHNALTELSSLVTTHLGGECQLSILDRNNPEVSLT